MTKTLVILAIAMTMLGCVAIKPIISDLEQDKVIVMGGMGTTKEALIEKAAEGCAIHGRQASEGISKRCLDQYCIRALYLFACKLRP